MHKRLDFYDTDDVEIKQPVAYIAAGEWVRLVAPEAPARPAQPFHFPTPPGRNLPPYFGCISLIFTFSKMYFSAPAQPSETLLQAPALFWFHFILGFGIILHNSHYFTP